MLHEKVILIVRLFGITFVNVFYVNLVKFQQVSHKVKLKKYNLKHMKSCRIRLSLDVDFFQFLHFLYRIDLIPNSSDINSPHCKISSYRHISEMTYTYYLCP